MTAKNILDDKALLRAEILAGRNALSVEYRNELNTRISRQLLGLDSWHKARCALLYLSFGSEYDTSQLVEDALVRGMRLYLPRVNRDRNRIEVHWVTNPTLETAPSSFGIREPKPECPRAELNKIDFILVPGVAFTPRCERLGYGGGYYDRLLSELQFRPQLVAAAFEMQIRAQIPLTENDQRIDRVITEQTIYCIS